MSRGTGAVRRTPPSTSPANKSEHRRLHDASAPKPAPPGASARMGRAGCAAARGCALTDDKKKRRSSLWAAQRLDRRFHRLSNSTPPASSIRCDSSHVRVRGGRALPEWP
eukprot:6440556-Prymnesium_polylepis.1